ncbi:MAG: hypothetical protein WCS70_04410 [Verrucomicrobiota bacterium]
MTDRELLRSLARQVRELAAHPELPERRQLWLAHNALQSTRPLIVCFPEGAWGEILPDSALQCQTEPFRGWERTLRQQIHTATQLQDDTVTEPFFDLGWHVNVGDYGVQVPYTHGDNRGSYVWEAPLKNLPADLDKLHPRSLTVDRAGTERDLALATETFGDILPVRLRWQPWWTTGLTWEAVKLVGLEELMLLMYDNPAAVHRLLAFLRDETLNFIGWFEREGLLTPNNAGNYCGSGGFAFSNELHPAETGTRLKDYWGFAESQETVGVSPAMFEEFILPYQLPVLEKFGLTYYGCCEGLEHRLDRVLKQVKNLRRVSVAPKANQETIAGLLQGRYVYCRKADPVPVCVDFNERDIRTDLRRTLALAKGQPLEIILKDTHTVQNEPHRLARWVEIAREEIAAAT